MSYRVRLASRVRERLSSWTLPPAVYVDVGLRLERLQDRPAERLVPIAPPFRGMAYRFTLIDPDNRLAEYAFSFQVMYGQDEETLHVVNGWCQVSFG